MTSFRDRLKRLHDAHHRGRDSEGSPSGVYRADEASEDVAQPPTAGGWEALGAVECLEYDHPIWIATERCDANSFHGDWRLDQCRDVPHPQLANLRTDLPAEIDRGRLLYMDTETTGLGEGSLAFMIGLGFWDGEEFVVEQLLLEDDDGEPSLLEAFAERMERFDVLVTFNGKGFDVPLLKRRYAVYGMDTAFFDTTHHLDLLPLARRIFPGLDRYKLTSLEENLLGFERIDDVPGREIPKRWWKFKKTYGSELMAGVLEHNRHDVVSMMVLVARAIAGECPDTAQIIDESNRRRGKGIKGFGSWREKKSDDPTVEEPQRPTEGIAKRLERSYRLRGRFSRKDRRPEKRPVASTPKEDTIGADAKARIAELRRGCQTLIDQKMWREAFPLLCELVALSPDDDWGLEMLARYYRREGEEKLALELEKRRGG